MDWPDFLEFRFSSSYRFLLGENIWSCILDESDSDSMSKNEVHPGLPWVKVESTAVEKDSYFEVLSITKAACSSLDGHDLTVDAFGY